MLKETSEKSDATKETLSLNTATVHENDLAEASSPSQKNSIETKTKSRPKLKTKLDLSSWQPYVKTVVLTLIANAIGSCTILLYTDYNRPKEVFQQDFFQSKNTLMNKASSARAALIYAPQWQTFPTLLVENAPREKCKNAIWIPLLKYFSSVDSAASVLSAAQISFDSHLEPRGVEEKRLSVATRSLAIAMWDYSGNRYALDPAIGASQIKKCSQYVELVKGRVVSYQYLVGESKESAVGGAEELRKALVETEQASARLAKQYSPILLK